MDLRFSAALIAIAVAATAVAANDVSTLLKSKSWEASLKKSVKSYRAMTPEFIRALNDKNPQTRALVARAIRILDTEGCEIRDNPKDGIPTFRAAALAALAKSARDSNPTVSEESIWTMTYLVRNREFGQHGEAWSDPAEVQPVINLGQIAIGPLVKLLRFDEKKDKLAYAAKIAAVRVLSKSKDPAAMEGLVELIKTSSHFLVSEAMYALVKFDDPRVVGILINRMDEGINSYSGTPGLWALRKMKARAIPELLIAAEKHPKPRVRANAIHFFCQTPDPRCIPVIQRATNDPDANIRVAAAEAMASNHDPGNIILLRRMIMDTHLLARGAAVKSIGYVGGSADFDLVEPLARENSRFIGNQAMFVLTKLDPERAARQLTLLLDVPKVQRWAIEYLDPSRAAPAEQKLIRIAETGDEDSKVAAIELLGKLRSAAAIPILLRAVKEPELYASAFEALGRIGPPSVPSLIALAANSQGSEAWHLALALGKTRDPRAFETILSFLKYPMVRLSAISALGASGDPRAEPIILSYLNNSASDVLWYAAEAAGELKLRAAVPRLVQLLSHKGDYVASSAAESLGKIGDKHALAALIEVASRPPFEGRLFSIQALGKIGDRCAVPLLIQLLDAKWPDNSEAIEALGNIGDPAALSALQKLLLSDDDQLVKEATSAIEAIKRRNNL